jgi:hypothetical protein
MRFAKDANSIPYTAFIPLHLATCLFAFTLFPALLTLTPAFSSLLPTSRWQFLTSPQYTNGDFDGRNL